MPQHDDRLILLLRDLAALAELRRDSSPFAIVPRSMRGGSALGSMISRASNAPTDATDAQVRRLTQYLLTGRGQTATQVRGALLLRIAEEPLPGDPAAEYDPVHAQEVARRVEVAPPRIRCVLDALRHVPTPYDPREAVCQRLADVLAPPELFEAWRRKDRDVPPPLVWAGALLDDALGWWFSPARRVA